jgi:hypothetical protein
VALARQSKQPKPIYAWHLAVCDQQSELAFLESFECFLAVAGTADLAACWTEDARAQFQRLVVIVYDQYTFG